MSKTPTNFEKVKEFHEAFNQLIGEKIEFPEQAVRELRKKLIEEEFKEYLEGEKKEDIENVAKELADLLYVVYGTGVAYGIPLDQVFAEVHDSNMSKLDEKGNPLYREDGKVLKGPNFFKANIQKILQTKL